MPIFEYNNRKIDVPEDKIEAFKKNFPTATLFEEDEKKVEITPDIQSSSIEKPDEMIPDMDSLPGKPMGETPEEPSKNMDSFIDSYTNREERDPLNPFARKGFEGASELARQYHAQDPELQFKAKYGAYKENPELFRDENAPELIERREKKPWYSHIGAGGSSMGFYNTAPIEEYGTKGNEEATSTRQSRDYLDQHVRKQDAHKETDLLSDFLVNTESGRELVEDDKELTKIYEGIEKSIGAEINALQEKIDQSSELYKISGRNLQGARIILEDEKEKLKDPSYKPSWRREQIVEEAQKTFDKESQRIYELDNNVDIAKAQAEINELKRGYNALQDRDRNAAVQWFKEARRRLPETIQSTVFLGLDAVAKQLDYNPGGRLTAEAEGLSIKFHEMTDNLYEHRTSMAQDIANGTLHSTSFMIQMAATSGLSSFIAKGIAKGALAGVGKVGGKKVAAHLAKTGGEKLATNLGRELLKDGTNVFLKSTANRLTEKGVGKVVRIAGKNISEAFVQTVLMPSTLAGALERNREEGGSFLNAYAKNFIAAFGEVGLERAGDFMPGFQFKSDFMKGITQYTHMNSFFPEILEEDLQTAWHALFKTGEGEWSDLIDPRNRLVTAGTIGMMQAGPVIAEAGGYAAGKYHNAKAQRQVRIGMEKNVANMQEHFGEKSKEMMKLMEQYVQLSNKDSHKMPLLVMPQETMDKFSEDQKDALATYTLAYGAQLGMERAKYYAKNKKEIDKHFARENARKLAETAQEKNSKQLNLLHNEIQGYVETLGDRFGMTEEELLADNSLEDGERAELIEATRKHDIAFEEFSTVLEGLEEQTDKFIQPRIEEINEITRKDGTVIRASLFGDIVYVVKGDIAFNEDGSIDKRNSSEHLIVKNENGIKLPQVPLRHITFAEQMTAEEMITEVKRQAKEKYIDPFIAKVEGTVTFEIGEEVSFLNDKGETIVGKVGSKTQDGVVSISTNDGKILSFTEQDLASRQVTQSAGAFNVQDEVQIDIEGEPHDAKIVKIEDGKISLYVPNAPTAEGRYITVSEAELNSMLYNEAEVEEALKAEKERADREYEEAKKKLEEEEEPTAQTTRQIGDEVHTFEGDKTVKIEKRNSDGSLTQTWPAKETVKTKEEVKSEVQETVEETVQETEEEAEDKFPRKKDGKVDFESIQEPATYKEALESEFGKEMANEIVAEELEDAKKAYQAALKSKKGSAAERAYAKRDALARVKHFEEIGSIFINEQNEARSEAELDAEKKESERQALADKNQIGSIPDVVNDSPEDARARGYKSVNGVRVDRAKPLIIEKFKNAVRRFTTKSKDAIPVKRTIIEAKDAKPVHKDGYKNEDHFVEEAQPKNRTQGDSKASKERIAANIDVEQITEGPTAYVGAPVVNSRGEVIQGNNRTDALQAMYGGFPEQAKKYKEYLMANAEKYGMTAEEVSAMENPIAVDIAEVDDVEMIRLGQLEAADMESGGSRRIDGKRVGVRLKDRIKNFANILFKFESEDVSLRWLINKNGVELLQWLNNEGHITETQYITAINKDGYLTEEAKIDLESIMMGVLFEGGKQSLEQQFLSLPAKAQKTIMQVIHRDMEMNEADKMKGHIQEAISAYHALASHPEFKKAKTYQDAKEAIERGAKPQTKMFDGESTQPLDGFSDFALELAAIFHTDKQTELRQRFNDYYDAIQGIVPTGLFETAEAGAKHLSKVEAISKVFNDFKLEGNDKTGSDNVAESSGKSQEGQQLEGKAESGERVEVEKGEADNTEGTGADTESTEVKGPKFKANRQTVSYMAEIASLEKEFGVKATVHTSTETIGNTKARNQIEADIKGDIPMANRAKGWMVDGEVHIYLPHAESIADIYKTYIHEAIGHKGVREFLGAEKHDALMETIYGYLPTDFKDRSLAQLKEIHPEKTDLELKRLVADEFVAVLSEDAGLKVEHKNIWEKIVEAVMKVLGKDKTFFQFGEAEKIALEVIGQAAQSMREGKQTETSKGDNVSFRKGALETQLSEAQKTQKEAQKRYNQAQNKHAKLSKQAAKDALYGNKGQTDLFGAPPVGSDNLFQNEESINTGVRDILDDARKEKEDAAREVNKAARAVEVIKEKIFNEQIGQQSLFDGEDIRFRKGSEHLEAIEKVVDRFENTIELKENESKKEAPNLKELVLFNDVKDYGLYDKYEIVPVSNPLVNIHNLNRSIYSLGVELDAVNKLHNQTMLDFDGDTGRLNTIKVGWFSSMFKGAIAPYETALLKAKHFATEAAQREIMDIIKDIDHAKGYYKRLAEDHSVLRSEDAPRFRMLGEKGAATLDAFEESTIRINNLDVAKEMETKEKDALTIKRATGWERGADDKWRYETGDMQLSEAAKNIEVEGEAKYFAPIGEDAIVSKGILLKDFITDDNNLIEAYPQLEDTRVIYYKTNRGRLSGTDGFVMGKDIYIQKGDSKSETSTLIHEVQHLIQRIEGFEGGGNLDTGRNAYIRKKYGSFKEYYSLLDKLLQDREKLQEKANKINRELENTKRIKEELRLEFPDTKIPKLIRTEQNKAQLEKIEVELNKIIEERNTIDEDIRVNQLMSYTMLAGEVEARNASERMDMTPEERRNSLLRDTEGIAREDQLMIMNAVEEDIRFRQAVTQDSHEKAKEVQQELEKIGIHMTPSLSSTDYGKSAYFVVYHPDSFVPKLKVRISDHNVTNHDRIFGEEHFDRTDNARYIAEVIEEASNPERFEKVQVGTKYFIKDYLNIERAVEESDIDKETNKIWYNTGKQELDENRVKSIESSDNIRLKNKVLLRTSKRGNKVYRAEVERLLDVESKPIYSTVRTEESPRFRKVEPFKYGEGGTKGVFKGKDGTLYKSLQPGVLVWKDGQGTREYLDTETQEYDILKRLDGDKRFPIIGEKVQTSEGPAFEIEPLVEVKNLTLKEYEAVEATIQELNDKGIFHNDFISVMRRDNTNEVVINDFSSGNYDPSRAKDSYWKDSLFSRLEDLLSKEDLAELKEKRAQKRLEEYQEMFPDEDLTIDDVRYRRGNMAALHNIGEEHLMEALNGKGLIAPSIGVTNVENEYSDFGAITLIAPKKMVDPTKERVRVFAGDAYTPTVPRPMYHVNEKVLDNWGRQVTNKAMKISRDIANLIASEVHDYGSFYKDLFKYNQKSVVSEYENNMDMKLAYLVDSDIGFTVPMKEKQAYLGMNFYFDMTDAERERGKYISDKYNKETEASGSNVSEQTIQDYQSYIYGIISDRITEKYKNLDKEEREYLIPRMIDRLYSHYKDAINMGLYNLSPAFTRTREVDMKALEKRVNNKIVKRDYRAWLNNKVDEFQGTRYFIDGKEKRGYYAENILDYITRYTRGQEKTLTYGMNKAKSYGIKELNSIPAMQELRDILIPKEEMSKIDEAYSNEYMDLSSKVDYLDGDAWDGLNALGKALADHYKGMSPARALSKNGFDSKKGSEYFRDFAKRLKENPVDYFEAKMQRMVPISEFAAVAVPLGTSTETTKKLREAGLKVVKYDPTVEGDRQAKVEKASDKSDIRFRRDNAGFYSTVENALESVPQEKGTVNQFKAMLQKNGAKQGEMNWMDWDSFVEGKKSITKAEVQEWINDNRIEIEEVENSSRLKVELMPGHENDWQVVNREGVVIMANMAKQNAQEYADKKGKQRTLYSDYQEPGGENYREILLTLSDKKENEKIDKEIRERAESSPEWIENINKGNELQEKFNRGEISASELSEKYNDLLLEREEIRGAWDDLHDKRPDKFTSPHFYESNIAVHVRMNDRVDSEGNKVLFIEEMQSDWAQEGKKKGFAEKTDQRVKLNSIAEGYEYEKRGYYTEYDYNETPAQLYAVKKAGKGVLDMPFKNTDQWVNLAIRKIMMEATEGGYDKVAWTTGEQQNERYKLSNHIDKINYIDYNDGAYSIESSKNGATVLSEVSTLEQIEATYGKEIAQKIKDKEGTKRTSTPQYQSYSLEGIDLEVGGEGMKGFYNKILPSQANKLGKRFGAKVEAIEIDGLGQQLALPVTEKMIDSTDEGMPLFRRADNLMDNADNFKDNVKDYNAFLNNALNNAVDKQALIDKARSEGLSSLPKVIEQYLAEIDNPAELEAIKNELRVDMPDEAMRYLLWRNANPNDGSVAWRAKESMKMQELDPNVLFRRGSIPLPNAFNEYERRVRSRYNKGFKAQMFRIEEGWFDKMTSLRILQEAIAGKDIPGNQNAYQLENQLSSKNAAEIERYNKRVIEPMLKAVHKVFGNSLTDADLYLMAKHGLERNDKMAYYYANEFYKQERQDLMSQAREANLFDDAYNEAMNELNRKVRELYEEYKENDYSGLTEIANQRGLGESFLEAGQNIVAEVEGRASQEDINELWARVNEANKIILKKQFDSGKMSQGEYEQIKGMYDFYVPLRGFDAPIATDYYSYLENKPSEFSSVLKKAWGRKSKADSPIATMMNMSESGFMEANRNVMKQAFLQLVQQNKSDLASVRDFWYVKDAEGNWTETFPEIPEGAMGQEVIDILDAFDERMEALGEDASRGRNNLDVGVKILPAQASEHAVRVWMGGKESIVYVNGNPRAAQAINGLIGKNHQEDGKTIMNGIRHLNRMMASNFTSNNPVFVVTNLLRDVQFAVTAGAIKEGGRYSANLALNIAKTPKTVAQNLWGQGNEANSEYQQYWDEFLMGGGETGYTQINTMDKHRKFVNSKLREFDNKVDVLSVFRGYVKQMETVNRLIESNTRFATFVTSRQAGRDVQRSVADAKEITINFNRKGSGGFGASIAHDFFLFSNPAIQSARMMGLMAKNQPKAFFGALAASMSGGFLTPIMNEFLLQLVGDDDDKEKYWNINPWVRRNNLVLYLPWTESKFLTIPLPHELRAFHGIGEMAYAKMTRRMRHENIAKEVIGQFSNMLPMDMAGEHDWFVPDALKPIEQGFWSNKNYQNRPIYKKTPWNERYPEWTKAYKNTPEMFIDFSKWTNERSGGDDVKKGKADVRLNNPAVLNTLVQGYFGGALTMYTDIADLAYKLITKEEVSVRDVPFVNKLVRESSSDVRNQNIYSEYSIYKEWYKDFKHDLDGYDKLRRDNPLYQNKYREMKAMPEYKTFKLMDRRIKAIDKLRDENPERYEQKMEEFIKEMHMIEDGY